MTAEFLSLPFADSHCYSEFHSCLFPLLLVWAWSIPLMPGSPFLFIVMVWWLHWIIFKGSSPLQCVTLPNQLPREYKYPLRLLQLQGDNCPLSLFMLDDLVWLQQEMLFKIDLWCWESLGDISVFLCNIIYFLPWQPVYQANITIDLNDIILCLICDSVSPLHCYSLNSS